MSMLGIGSTGPDSADREQYKKSQEQTNADRDASRKIEKETADAERDQAKAQRDEAKGEGKLAGAWGKMKGFASGAVEKTKNNSTLAMLTGFGFALACYYLKVSASSTRIAFIADFFMLMYCYSRFGSESIYVFLISFFLPTIAGSIVSGMGIPTVDVAIVVLVIISLNPTIRSYLSKNGKVMMLEVTFVALTVLAAIFKAYHFPQYWHIGGAVDDSTMWGYFLTILSNQFFNMTWIVYIAVIKNPGEKILPGIIKMMVLVMIAGFLLGGPATAAGATIPGVNSPLVTEEGKQQFKDALKQGGDFFNGVPIMDKAYAAVTSLFNIVSNVPVQAQAMADTIAPSKPAEDVVPTGLALAASEYSQKTFTTSKSIYADFKITESQKIQDSIKFTETAYKVDTDIGWSSTKTPKEDCNPRKDQPFYLSYPEETEFRCKIGDSCAAPKSCDTGYTNEDGTNCCHTGKTDCYSLLCSDEKYTVIDGKCCPIGNLYGDTTCIKMEEVDTSNCLLLGSHTVKARAIYNMTSSSSYTPIFVDRTKKIAAEKGGNPVLSQCGLQDYAMPVAIYTPSNSPAALGIVLSQPKMPVVIDTANKDMTAPLWLIVSLKKIHSGFVSEVTSLTVKLPQGIGITLGDSCDFEGNGPYTAKQDARDRVKLNPEKGETISFRCLLDVKDQELLGNTLCTPVTITADANYKFTLEASTSIEVVRDLTASTTKT